MIDKQVLSEQLNPVQVRAASTIEGALLIIAGAGSGKTRVITYRIAYMLSQGISPKQILALTFTNKAAQEMKERVSLILGRKIQDLQILTFHSFGLYLLKINAKHLGYQSRFSIYDSTDKLHLIQEIVELNPALLPAEAHFNYVSELFSQIKSGMAQWDEETAVYQRLFNEYESFLKLYNAFDFDDLIAKALYLLKNNPSVSQACRKRYTHILVDEFQDTSFQQYELLKELALASGNICCVGDDDQSIYSWRGANYENIRLLEKDFPNLVEIKLEQNYRSTQLILEAANAVIRHNHERKKKVLWSEVKEGKAISFMRPSNEAEEANFIAQQIKWLAFHEGINYQQIAILTRTNSLFREIELALRSCDIDYQISGGSSFFQKKEIKDLIAYLRVMVNPNDDFSLLRIVNTPRRGIGKETLENMRQISLKQSQSLYESMKSLLFSLPDISLSETTSSNIQEFIALMEDYHYQFYDNKESYAFIFKTFLKDIGYYDYCKIVSSSRSQAEYREKNIQIFLDILYRWELRKEERDKELSTFLNMISLQSKEEEEVSSHGLVNLMTIHASKGLEWDIVFLAGVEEGILPHRKSLEENEKDIEEERRLFYVALTRACQRVIITASQERKKGKEVVSMNVSRFIAEIPEHLIEEREDALDPQQLQLFWENFFAKNKKDKQKDH